MDIFETWQAGVDEALNNYEQAMRSGLDDIDRSVQAKLLASQAITSLVTAETGRERSDRDLLIRFRVKEASPELRLDIRELDMGIPLSRHAWLQDILDNPDIGPNSYGQNPPRSTCLEAMIKRVNELTSVPERDMELERATVALGFYFSSGPDYDGNWFSYEWVRSPEVYERPRQNYTGLSPRNYSHGVPKRSDIVGIGKHYGLYKLGKDLGYTDSNADRWFVTCAADGVAVDIPFNAITEVVDRDHFSQGHEYGSVIESPTDRGTIYCGWIKRKAA